MKCESLGITFGTLKHQYLHGMNLNKLVNLTAKVTYKKTEFPILKLYFRF